LNRFQKGTAGGETKKKRRKGKGRTTRKTVGGWENPAKTGKNSESGAKKGQIEGEIQADEDKGGSFQMDKKDDGAQHHVPGKDELQGWVRTNWHRQTP